MEIVIAVMGVVLLLLGLAAMAARRRARRTRDERNSLPASDVLIRRQLELQRHYQGDLRQRPRARHRTSSR
jgi:type II secretory pathway pseudopilin PulG